MKFEIWVKRKNAKRWWKSFTTESSKRADLIANNEMKVLCNAGVKVVCYDGYTKETLIYM